MYGRCERHVCFSPRHVCFRSSCSSINLLRASIDNIRSKSHGLYEWLKKHAGYTAVFTSIFTGFTSVFGSTNNSWFEKHTGYRCFCSSINISWFKRIKWYR
mmetsp:Transcript_61123/g.101685  ORF Transcript_61123/g.101685 Transcript_61123/m.101685 type:complete len:101 (+) Transcript_61123:1033-1335(+)